MRWNCLVLLFSIIAFEVHSQKSIYAHHLDAKTLKIFEEGHRLAKQGKYDAAVKKYDKVLKKYASFHEAKLRKSGLFNDRRDFLKADQLLDEVVKSDAQYNADMYLLAAQIDKNLKRNGDVVNDYEQYLKLARIDEAQKTKIKKEVELYKFRVEAMAHPSPFKPEPIPGLVNSMDLEYLPYITIDGKKMVFTRRINGQEDLFVSTRDTDGNWGIPTALDEVNTKDNEAAHTMSADGNLIIFTVCNNKITGFGSCDLYLSRLNQGSWHLPKNLGPPINTSAWESQPCILNNGNTIIFSSNRKGSLGGNDLWMASKDDAGKWQEVVNLGAKVNSPQNEESPFMHADGKTLFFRSNGHIGMGAYDLFMVRYDEKIKKWGDVINLGYPINTEGDEGSLFVERDGKTAYYSSDYIKGERTKNLDILTFELPQQLRPEAVTYLKITTSDVATKKSIDVDFYIQDLDTQDTILIGKTVMGDYTTIIPKDKNLSLVIQDKRYYFHSENFNTKGNFDINQPFVIYVALKPIDTQPPSPIVLNNIFFKTASAELLDASYVEINNLANFLKSKENLRILITGHTDNIGNVEDNQKLSEERAKAVFDALVKSGIHQSRLKFEGRGESMPITSNESEEGRSKNRRTEFTLW